jgi:hypothetical protein
MKKKEEACQKITVKNPAAIGNHRKMLLLFNWHGDALVLSYQV